MELINKNVHDDYQEIKWGIQYYIYKRVESVLNLINSIPTDNRDSY